MASDTDILNSLSNSPTYSNLKPQIEGLRSQKHSDTDILNSLVASPKYSMMKPQVEQFRVDTGETTKSEPAGGFPNLGKTALNLIPNVASTVLDIGKNIITHPIESAKNIVLAPGALPVGAAEKVIQNWGGATGKKFLDWFGRGALDNFWQPFENQLKEKYGSYEKFKKTIEERPAEAMLDVSTALGIGAKVGKSPAMAKAAEYTSPISLASKGISESTSAIGKRMAPRIYESTLKIPPSVPANIRNQAVRTGLEGRYLPTDKGLAKLQNDITATNKKIAGEIDKATTSGKMIDYGEVVKRIDQLKEFYGSLPSGRAKTFIDELEEIKAQYLTGGKVSAQAAQKAKQAIYAIQRKHYGEMKSLTVEADKSVARGLKEELVAAHPELKALNAKDSALINLDEVLERAVHKTRNYDIVKFSDTIATVAGGALGGPVGAAALGASKSVFGMPGVKARIAFALDKAAKKQKRDLPYGVRDIAGSLKPTSNLLYQSNQITKGQNEAPTDSKTPKEEMKQSPAASPELPKESTPAPVPPVEVPKSESKPDPHARQKGESLKQWTDRLYKLTAPTEKTEGNIIKGAHGSY